MLYNDFKYKLKAAAIRSQIRKCCKNKGVFYSSEQDLRVLVWGSFKK